MTDYPIARLAPRPFWYLRHGETDWNARGLSQGRSDIPLNDTGIAQGARAAAMLARHWNEHGRITRIVSSPLGRALRTAELVRDALRDSDGVDLPITTDIALQEVCFGVQEGEPMGDWYDSWIANDYVPQGAEPFPELVARAVGAVNKATEGDGLPMIVCHGAMFRALRKAMGLPANVRLPNAVPLWLRPGEPDPLPWLLVNLGEAG
ncbi:histidine phosphatase family protein [Acetobacteraceae bacterium KSS12]|uniref:Histidine phosphatase family protein n=1 Tax=Rhizosaccharibacter radicis TaxID=2782605 RepID=A0ABT1VZF9_9PROT|nr:histidine phosphatase family protein [Acetobacteraceae bacterium KSS12]